MLRYNSIPNQCLQKILNKKKTPDVLGTESQYLMFTVYTIITQHIAISDIIKKIFPCESHRSIYGVMVFLL